MAPMVSTDDLTRRDMRIPGLSLLLNPDRLADALHARLGKSPIGITSSVGRANNANAIFSW